MIKAIINTATTIEIIVRALFHLSHLGRLILQYFSMRWSNHITAMRIKKKHRISAMIVEMEKIILVKLCNKQKIS